MVGDTAGGLLTDAIYKRTGDVNKARRNAVIVGFAGSLIFLLPVLFVHDKLRDHTTARCFVILSGNDRSSNLGGAHGYRSAFRWVAGGIMSTAAGTCRDDITRRLWCDG